MRYEQLSFLDVPVQETLSQKMSRVAAKATQIAQELTGSWKERLSKAFKLAWKEIKNVKSMLKIDANVKISRGWEYQEIKLA